MDPRVRERAELALRRVLTRDLELRVDENDHATFVIAVSVQGDGLIHRFAATWAGEGWPADVMRAARLAPHAQVVVAHEVSAGAKDWLEEQGLGWADETGAARIVLPSGLIVIREGARPQGRKPRPRQRWSPAMIAAAEAILSGTKAQVRPIQEATRYSRGAVTKALDRLAGLGVLTSEKARGPASGRHVADAAALLDEYARAIEEALPNMPRVLLHRLWSDPVDALVNDVAPALNQSGVPWAATGASASLLLAPYLSGTTIIDLYVGADLFNDPQELSAVLGARIVQSGHRIEVRPMQNPVTANGGRTVDGVHCAAAARVYADLRATGGRAGEAADHLREVLDVGGGA
jgi:hypothetical protein